MLKHWIKKLLKKAHGPKTTTGVLRGSTLAPTKILFIVDSIAPTFSISFDLPLAALVDNKQIACLILTQQDFQTLDQIHFGKTLAHIRKFQPTHIVFSRYGGRYYKELLQWAQSQNLPSIYHIDDDLFEFPSTMPNIYKQRHLSPDVLGARQWLITNCDHVYCSTPPLEHLLKQRFQLKNTSTGIYCPYPGVHAPLSWNATHTIGYMGTKSHQQDLLMIIPLIHEFLRKNPNWKFDLFGDFQDFEFPEDIQKQIIHSPPVRGYSSFREALNKKNWTAAFAPLQKEVFNQVKAPTKFIEYTAMGAVTFASDWGPYTPMIQSGVAHSIEQLTAESLHLILSSPQNMADLHKKAHSYCAQQFAMPKLTEQVVHLFNNVAVAKK